VADHPKFQVQVLTPEGEVFDGEVEQLSTRTSVGEVGILANHAPLMVAEQFGTLAALFPGRVDLGLGRAPGTDGLVFGNHALILVGEAVAPESLDQAQLKEKLTEAESQLAGAEEGSAAQQTALQDKERCETFLAIAQGS